MSASLCAFMYVNAAVPLYCSVSLLCWLLVCFCFLFVVFSFALLYLCFIFSGVGMIKISLGRAGKKGTDFLWTKL